MKQAVDKTPEIPVAGKKKRILVVDDESSGRMFLLNELKKAGLETETASNGGIALRKLKDGNFDAIILDVMLADVKVPDLVKQIRKTETWADLKIFVCVNSLRPDPWRGRAAKNGVTKVFDKTTSTVDVVVAEIASHLKADAKEARASAPTPTPTPGSPVAKIEPAKTTQESPLPVQRDTSMTKRANAAAPLQTPSARSSDTAFRSHRESKTGFFHNPPTTNTALLRQAAQAGQANSGPVITGDTPLQFLPAAEASSVTPAPPVAAEPAPVSPPSKGFAEKIIAPFKIFSRSDSGNDSKRMQELEQQLAEVTRNRDELLALLRDQPIFGPLSGATAPVNTEGLQEAKAAATRADAAYQAELARSRQFEEELKRIREARDDLNRKLAEEEKAAAESRRRSKELEERLTQSAAELDQVKSELQKHIAEHAKIESDLRQQLTSARQSAETAKVAYQEQTARANRSNEELAALRHAREELNARLSGEAQAAAESKQRSEERERQLREKQAEVERLKAELSRHAADKELSDKLSAAQLAAQNAEAACKEEAARRAQFEQDLARLKQAREELNGKLAREEQAAVEARRRSEEMERQLAERTDQLDHVKTELDRHAEERKALEKELQQQVAAANTAAEDARRAFRQESVLFGRSKEEIENLRQARNELNAKFEQEQRSAAESRCHSEELESKLQEASRELAHLRAELEKHVNERAALVNTSSRQLHTAQAAAAKAEKAYQEQLKRSAKFEKELAALRQDRTQLKTELKGSVKSKRRIQELEKQAAAHAAELEKAREELEKQLSERERLESEHRQTAELPSQPRSVPQTADAAEAEARFRESISALARATADLEKERGERRRVEQRVAFLSGQLENLHEELRKHLEVEKGSQERIVEFERHVRDRDDALARAVSDLQREAASRQLAEAQLKAKGEMGSQLQEQFNLLEEAKRVFNAAQHKLEARLEAAEASLTQTKAKLQKQTAERKRLETVLEEAQRKLQEQSHQSASELARLQSALQVEVIERRKFEGQSLQSRYASLDASRLGRAFVNSFRTHLRPSAEHLLQASRRLLELPLEEEHKKLVEELLEDALLLQTSMQNDASLPGETDAAEPAKAA